MDKIFYLGRLNNLCVSSFLLSMVFLSSLVQATVEEDFIAANSLHRSPGWEGIDNVNHVIASPNLNPGPVASIGSTTFSLLKVMYDDVPLERNNLAKWQGQLNGQNVSLEISYNWDSVTHRPINNIVNVSEGNTPLQSLGDPREERYFELARPATPSTFSNLATWLQGNPAHYNAIPHVLIYGTLNDGRALSLVFQQKTANDTLICYPIQLSHILYAKEQNRLGVFCRMCLPNFGVYFECIKHWDISIQPPQKHKLLPGELYYDGHNIYDKISTPIWLSDWIHPQITPENKQRLITETLHYESPRTLVAINQRSQHNPHPIIPIKERYRLNNAYHPNGLPVPHESTALYSNGHALFLARCLRQGWNSLTQPQQSYSVEYFIDTMIAANFDHNNAQVIGQLNVNNTWEEGLYIAESSVMYPQQTWRRSHSTHNSSEYTYIFQREQGIQPIQFPKTLSNEQKLEYFSYSPLIKILTTPPLSQDILEKHLPRMTTLRELTVQQKEPKFLDFPHFINTVFGGNSFPNLRTLTIRVPHHSFYIKNNNLAAQMGTILATLPQLQTLQLLYPNIKSFSKNAYDNTKDNYVVKKATPIVGGTVLLAGGFLGGAMLGGVGTIIAGVEGAGAVIAAGSAAETVVGGAALGGAAVGGIGGGIGGILQNTGEVIVGAPSWIGGNVVDLGYHLTKNSYKESIDFARNLGQSKTLQNITFYGVSYGYDKNNIRNAIQTAAAAQNPPRNIAVTFQ